MRHVIRHRRWRDDQSGMSLVEIMIAVFVLSVGLLALASTAITSIVNLRVSRGRQEATDAASALIEDLRRSDFSLVALDETDPTTADYLADQGGCDPQFDEPLVATSLPGGLPHEQSFGPSGRVTLRTHISWYDEGDDHACGDAAHDRRVKRVRVVAEWSDADRTFSLEESTLVAAVDRGLPAPDFRVGTPDLDVSLTEDQLGEEQCVSHVINNVGADDGYDFTMERTDAGSVIKTDTGKGEFGTANGDVRVRAFFEHPTHESGLNPAELDRDGDGDTDVDDDVPSQAQRHTNMPADLQLLIDGNGNDRPETDPALSEKLPTGDQGRLWICYLADTDLSAGFTIGLEFTIHSQLDENRSEIVKHDFSVVAETRTFYLYDDDTSLEGADSSRAETDEEGNVDTALPTLPMGPQTTLQPRHLGTGVLHNYDTDLDPTYPGLQLPPGQAAGTVVFHQQIPEDVIFEPQVSLDLFSASEEALADALAGRGSTEDRWLRYRVQLSLLAADEKTAASTPLVWEFWDDHPTVGWRPMSRTLSMGSSLAVSANQYLRLEVTCLDVRDGNDGDSVSVPGESCHLAYDNTSYDASISMVVQ